jgi:hypothetical protein
MAIAITKGELTHVRFVLERVFASAAVEMGRALPVEDAMLHQALLRRPIPLETFLIDRRVFAVIIRMHLHITSADVGFITFVLYAVVMRLLSVVLTVAKLDCAIVRRCEPEKAGEEISTISPV